MTTLPGSSRRQLLSALACACMAAFSIEAPSGQVSSSGWPALPVPPGARRYLIADSIEQNGMPMRIQGFETQLPLADVLRFFDRWLADKQGVTRQPRGEGWLMGARMGDYQLAFNFQRAAGNATEASGVAQVAGTLSAARLRGRAAQTAGWRAQAAEALPLPPGTTILSDTQSVDGRMRNRVVMAVNRIAVDTNTLYLREHLIARGWTVIEERALDPGRSREITLRRQQADRMTEALITVVRQGNGQMIVGSLTTGGIAE